MRHPWTPHELLWVGLNNGNNWKQMKQLAKQRTSEAYRGKHCIPFHCLSLILIALLFIVFQLLFMDFHWFSYLFYIFIVFPNSPDPFVCDPSENPATMGERRNCQCRCSSPGCLSVCFHRGHEAIRTIWFWSYLRSRRQMRWLGESYGLRVYRIAVWGEAWLSHVILHQRMSLWEGRRNLE